MLPAHSYLDMLHIPYTLANFSSSTPKGAANVAIALRINENQTVKTLIFSTDKGEEVLVMVGSNKNVISGHLKKVVGSRNIKLANQDIVLETTGYQIGSIPPFAWQPDGFRSFFDLELLNEKVLAVGAGVWGNEILISPLDLLKASSAIAVNLTNHELPIYI